MWYKHLFLTVIKKEPQCIEKGDVSLLRDTSDNSYERGIHRNEWNTQVAYKEKNYNLKQLFMNSLKQLFMSNMKQLFMSNLQQLFISNLQQLFMRNLK